MMYCQNSAAVSLEFDRRVVSVLFFFYFVTIVIVILTFFPPVYLICVVDKHKNH